MSLIYKFHYFSNLLCQSAALAFRALFARLRVADGERLCAALDFGATSGLEFAAAHLAHVFGDHALATLFLVWHNWVYCFPSASTN